MSRWLLAATLALSGCCLTQLACPVPVHTTQEQAGSLTIVRVWCGAQQIRQGSCLDGGRQRKTAKGWEILCDGAILATIALPAAVTETK